MKKTFFIFSLIAGFVLSCNIAWAGFYVIAAAGQKAKRTVLVSPQSTNTESGTALLNALSTITDASDTKPYLIIIEPGIYDVGTSSLYMKPYVDIAGSGENVTKIVGTCETDYNGVVMGADNAELRFLSIENLGNGSTNSNSVGINTNSSSPKITHVTVTARDGNMDSIAIYNNIYSYPTLTDVTINAHDASQSRTIGINVNGLSSVELKNSTIEVSGDLNNTGGVYGIFAAGANSIINLDNVTINALAGFIPCGVMTHSEASVNIQNSSIVAAGVGVYNAGAGGGVNINSSTIKGGSNSVTNNNSLANFLVGASKLEGPTGPNLTCAFAYDINYSALDATCN